MRTNRQTIKSCSSLHALILAGGMLMPAAALAQGPVVTDSGPVASGPAPVQGNGEIMVTARKKSEDILKTPLAVSALTSEDIEKRGVVSLNDVSNFVPGVNIVNNAAGRNDRSFQQVIIRGFAPSAATNPTTSLFIDGVPVSSPTAFFSIGQPERIEVLKGPQSAYFGRNTFAGAINVVNKQPSDHFGASLDAMIGTRANYKIHADVDGPLIGDAILFRASFDRFSKNGSYKNAFNPHETLGDQRTTSGSLLLVAKPTSTLTFKAFGLYSEDHDGPSAQGLISAYTLTDATGKVVVPGQSNCTLTGRSATGAAVSNPFFCGTAPSINRAYTPSINTTNDSFIKNFLASPNGRIMSPDDGVQGYGLVRRYIHAHFLVDWETPLPGLTLSSLTGYNNERYSQLADIDNYGSVAIPNNGTGAVPAGARSYFDYPYLVERWTKDFSQEVRATFDDNGPVHGTLGLSYLRSRVSSDLGGGNGGLGTTVFATQAGDTLNRTLGAFFGLTWEISSKLSVSAEGRYQIDKLYAFAQPGGLTATTDAFVPAGFYPGGSLLLKRSYKNFLPRVIAQYQITPAVMAYASFSKGVNPALFNTSFLTFSQPLQRAAQNAGITIDVSPEKVTNYEVGLKGRLFDNRLRFALDGYFAPWRNQINAITLNEADPVTQTIQVVRGSANTGSVNMKGIELDGSFKATEALDINFSAALTDSEIKKFQNATVQQLSGVTDFSGNEMPYVSKWSASVGAQYNGHFAAPDTSWFARVDYAYKSGVWSNAANIVKSQDINKVNIRAGVGKGNVSLEGFITNLNNNKSYTSIVDTSVLANNFRYSTYSSGLVVGLPELRTYGIEIRYKF